MLAPDALFDAVKHSLVMRIVQLGVSFPLQLELALQLLRVAQRGSMLRIAVLDSLEFAVEPRVVLLALH